MKNNLIEQALNDYKNLLKYLNEDKLGHKYETKFYNKRLQLALKEVEK